jgi:tetratricopeptide (TPR) repeat protein
VWAYTRHGMAWTEKGEFDQAVAAITEAVTIDPKYAFGFGQRGQALFKKRLIAKKGGWEPAIADYSEAIKLDPDLVWLYSARGVAYSNNANTTSPCRIAARSSSASPRIPADTIASASRTKA